MPNLHIEIVGMTCEHCVRAVRNRLSSTAGVDVTDVKIGSVDLHVSYKHLTLPTNSRV